MFIEVIIISLLLGLVLKGSIKNFKDVDLNHLGLVFIGFATETILVLLIRNGIIINSYIVYILHFSMYIMLFIFIYFNRKFYEISLMGIGFFLNALAIFTNGGKMPVSSEAAIKVGMGNFISNIANEGLYKLVDNSTNLSFLCDIIPKPYPRPFIVSIGDIITAVGLFLLILKLMGIRKFQMHKQLE